MIIGPVNIELSGLGKVLRVETAVQMNEAVIEAGPFDIAICAAAVGDWRPKEKAKTKIKKTPGDSPPILELIENPDILRNICTSKNRPDLVIGFAAETDDLLANARLKLKKSHSKIISLTHVLPFLKWNFDLRLYNSHLECINILLWKQK